MIKNNNKKTHSSSSKSRTAENDEAFISCNDGIGKMLRNICISEVAVFHSGE